MKQTLFSVPIVSLFVCSLLLACSSPGSGTDRDAADSGSDADAVDTSGDTDDVGPTILSTDPAHGATDVATSIDLTVHFSEPMASDVGMLTGDIAASAVDGRWTDDSTWVLTMSALPVQATVVVEFTQFRDLAGHPIPATTLSFDTADDIPPVVLEATPPEGEDDVLNTISEIQVTFSEDMDADMGRFLLMGDPGSLGQPTWDGAQLTIPVSDLAAESDYRVQFTGLRDRPGNLLDGDTYLGDNHLDFRTGPDVSPPQVVASNPAEGQLDVDIDAMNVVTVTFSEPMNPFKDTFTYEDTSGARVVTSTWTSDTEVEINLPGIKPYDSAVRIELIGLRDVAGNALDQVPYLSDGWLDFEVGQDRFDPFVVGSVPGEGESLVDIDTSEIVVTFSEAMDPGTTQLDVNGTLMDVTWDVSASIMTVDVANRLISETSYHIDLTGLTDVGGNAISVSDAYLVDGALDFDTVVGDGDSCRHALTVNQAVVEGAGWRWTFSAGAVNDIGGTTELCDPDGPGVDVVVRYEKTSDTLANGGQVLHVLADFGGQAVNLEIADGCEGPVTTCDWQPLVTERYLDVGPGTYTFRVAVEDSTAPLQAGSIVVDEVAGDPVQGESCLNPFDATSPFHSTTSNRWDVPSAIIERVDVSAVTGDNNAGSCNPSTTWERYSGADAVFVIPKTTSTRPLSATVSTLTGELVSVELRSDCPASSPSTEPNRCLVAQEDPTITINGPAQDYFLVVSSPTPGQPLPSLTVTYGEPSLSDGRNCDKPATLAGPGNYIATGTRAHFASCMGTSEGLGRFYTYTAPSDGVVMITSDFQAAVYDSTHRELGCVQNANVTPIGVPVRANETICFAVGRSVSVFSPFTVEHTPAAFPFDTRTDLVLDTPLHPFTMLPYRFADADWLAVDGSVHAGLGVDEQVLSFLIGPTPTVTNRDERDHASFSHVGRSGAVYNGQLFTLDDELTSAVTPRVWNLWDGIAPTWAPTPWDASVTYGADPTRAMATNGAFLFYASHGAATTTFYRLSAGAPSIPVDIGSNLALASVVGLAVDNTYLYAAGEVAGVDGIYRLALADLTVPSTVPERISPEWPVTTVTSVGMQLSGDTDPDYLYLRVPGAVGVQGIAFPGGTQPVYIGRLDSAGALAGPYVLGREPTTGALYTVGRHRHDEGFIAVLE